MEKETKPIKINLQLFASEGTDGDNGDGGQASNSSEPSPRTFTQEEVNQMMAREKQQGKRSILKELGFESEDDLKKLTKQAKAFVDANKSDDLKSKEQSDEKDRQLQEALNKAKEAELKVSAMQLGVKPNCVDDVINLVKPKLGDDSEISQEIGELKKKYPFMFTDGNSDEGDGDGKKKKDDNVEGKEKDKKKQGTGSSVGGNKKSADDGEESLGARLAAMKKGAGNSNTGFMKPRQ